MDSFGSDTQCFCEWTIELTEETACWTNAMPTRYGCGVQCRFQDQAQMATTMTKEAPTTSMVNSGSF